VPPFVTLPGPPSRLTPLLPPVIVPKRLMPG
jgi:hypothetical protein